MLIGLRFLVLQSSLLGFSGPATKENGQTLFPWYMKKTDIDGLSSEARGDQMLRKCGSMSNPQGETAMRLYMSYNKSYNK